ncbi:uncharacterized protein FOMMEDRAFT_150373 [Fomitiporia mediterranea MF3/22]|uniref:uncharacterized protein n=1 Tax=Fomitiporia mediterranea (strain MF3/22) TaxID=694068 RepID=UPI0004408A07|nr:uncharacterized protein FOMMEDRAFT_150373 [Fomitiporia mediterranea MF3/22]EJD07811.1 hypothetical protein FOMMEDRAFT_150373 [Fomitiporia mediterranea MF3/22]
MELGGTELGITDDEGKGTLDDEASQQDPALEGDDKTSVPGTMELGGTELGITDDEGKGTLDDEASQQDPALEGDDSELG